MITHGPITVTVLLALGVVALSGCGRTARTPVAGTVAPTTVTVAPPSPTTAPPTTAATTVPATTPIEPTRPTGARDELVEVEGTRFHARCDGAGATTVVLIPGFEASSDGWDAILPPLAERTRVCTYDRPGTGTSDPPASTQTFETQAADLRTMLTTMGEPGPYVVVGHSFGGVQAVEFTARSAGDVEALVLVDASPVGWPTALCAVDDGTGAAEFLRGMCDRWTDPTNNVEHLDVFASFDLAADPPSLGQLPLTVVTAVERELPPDISDAERARLTHAWDTGQERWSQLSASSRLVTVADTGHYVQIERPDLVVDEITRLLP